MTTLLLATVLFILFSIAISQPKEESIAVIATTFKTEGWQEPIAIQENKNIITDCIVSFKRKPKANRFADFQPSEWVFDCGYNTPPVIPQKLKMTRRQLLEQAKQQKLKGYSRMTTQQLEKALAV